MNNKYLKIPANRPLVLKRLIEILNSGPKTLILSILLDKGSMTAKELSRELGVKLSTILAHLSDLVKTGLVTVEYDGRQKKYKITSNKLILEIDLNLYLHLSERIEEERLKEVEELAIKYIEVKRKSDGLPLAITVKDVSSTLGIDRNTAIEVVDYINTYTDNIIETLAYEAVREFKNKRLTIKELSKKMNIHYYWATLIVQLLKSKGIAEVDDEGRIYLL